MKLEFEFIERAKSIKAAAKGDGHSFSAHLSTTNNVTRTKDDQ